MMQSTNAWFARTSRLARFASKLSTMTSMNSLSEPLLIGIGSQPSEKGQLSRQVTTRKLWRSYRQESLDLKITTYC
jgi:hypothetical protein